MVPLGVIGPQNGPMARDAMPVEGVPVVLGKFSTDMQVEAPAKGFDLHIRCFLRPYY
ncbi:hypothetical protein FHR32_007201 [Streptosporangium album]|uniref:Uncharacterized protein n=1 Tax=Streptosporangium album TaxID=47479 RepID=A0A7W7S2Q7_9ACTN|nr:hypothetical protein [Streptosporangium album]